MPTIEHKLTLNTETCCSCSIVFAMPDYLMNQKRGDGTSFYCPNGHPQHYTQSREKRLQLQLEEAERKMREAKCQAMNAEIRLWDMERETARNKKRLHAGVCPCCNRTFQNLARHMKTKHPEK